VLPIRPLRLGGWKGCLAALAVVGLSILARLALGPILGDTRPYLTLFGGVALAIWVSGWRSAAFAAIAGFAAAHALEAGGVPGAWISSFFAAEAAGYALSAGFIILIGEKMHRARERADRQRESLRVTLSSIGDAVITTDPEGRVIALNPVAEAVTGWGSAAARGMPLHEVFRIVNEFTREPAENPVSRALREGAIVGLANHTVLIRKDGAERPIDDSAAPIRDAGGELVGCVLVFRDITSRRFAEKQLWESREELRITLASIGDGVVVTDAHGKVRSLNAEAERLTGWKRAEAAGRPLTEVVRIVNETSGAPVENPVERVLREGATVGLANHSALIARSGALIPIADSAAPIREQDGPLYGAVLVFRDVSEERKAHRDHAQLASIIQSSGDAIFTKDVNGIVQSWNASAERLFGYRPEEIVGTSITRIIPPERIHEEAEILARIRAGKKLERVETVRLTKDGRRIPVQISVSPLHDADGRVIGASKIVHDIAEAVAARETLQREKEALQRSEERFRTMADAAPVLMWISDTDKLCTWFNQRWLDFVGRPMEQELGNGWVENVHPADLERCMNTYVSAFDRRSPFSMMYRLRRRDGEYRWLLDNGVPLHGADGAFAGYIGSCIDITDRQRAEAALQEADRRKDEFLSVLSHELRNPLAPIKMAVAMLGQIGPPDPELQELRDMIERQTMQLTHLLDDLLDVSRIASGKIELRKDRVSLAVAVANAVEALRPSIDSQEQELAVSLPEEPIHVHGDVVRLSQIFANLLSNASKYTDRRGRIEIAVSREHNRAVIRVRDSGIGISADQMSKIFVMFAQVNPSLERTKGGLGVGLALAQRLAELHGGRIEAKSEGLGRGSEFVVYLPLLPELETAPAEERPRAAKAPIRVRRRVLVADDNVDSAQVLAGMLRRWGHEVQVAGDGAAAIEAALSFRPEVAILDIGMPRVNGYEVARTLRARLGGQVVLVAVTGWGKEEDKRRAAEAGFDHHFTKPFDLEAIEDVLAAAPGERASKPPGGTR
jgi:PAS domain S-box-containing protein